jgi:hypothetical protein
MGVGLIFPQISQISQIKNKKHFYAGLSLVELPCKKPAAQQDTRLHSVLKTTAGTITKILFNLRNL